MSEEISVEATRDDEDFEVFLEMIFDGIVTLRFDCAVTGVDCSGVTESGDN